MAKSKVARPKKTASLTLIEYTRQDGETFARVRERSTGEFLAVAHGSRPFARAAAQTFARVWSAERVKAQPALRRHSARIDLLKRRATERASEAVSKLGGAS